MTKRLEKLYEELAALEAAEREAMRNISAYTDEELDSMVEAINAKEAEIDAEIANPTEDAQEEPKTVEVTMDNLEELTALIFGAEEFQAMKERAAKRTEAALEAFKNEIEEIMHEIDENNDIMSIEEAEQMTHKILLDTVDFDAKPTDKEVRAITSRLPMNQAEVSIEELAGYVEGKGRTFKPSLLNGTQKKDFISSSLIAVDIDNGYSKEGVKHKVAPEEYVSIDDFIEQCKREGLEPALMYKTFSHNDNWHRYRAIFQLERTITSVSELDEIYKVFKDKIKGIDEKVSSTAMIFGGKGLILLNPKATINPDNLLINSLVEDLNSKDAKVASMEEVERTTTEKTSLKKGIITDTLKGIYGNRGFESYAELKQYLLQINLADLLRLNNPRAFKCLFHNDNKPSAGIFKTVDGYIYNCLGGCLHSKKDIFDIVAKLNGYEASQAEQYMFSLKFLMRELNLKVRDEEWMQAQFEVIRENRLILTQNKINKSNYPALSPRMRHVTNLLRAMLDHAEAAVMSYPTKDMTGQALFFISYSKLSEMLEGKDIRTIKTQITELTMLGLIRKVSDEEVKHVAPKRYNQSLKYKIQNNQAHTVQYYSIPLWNVETLSTANEIKAQGNAAGITSKGIGIRAASAIEKTVSTKVEHAESTQTNADIDKMVKWTKRTIARNGAILKDDFMKYAKKNNIGARYAASILPVVIAQLDLKKVTATNDLIKKYSLSKNSLRKTAFIKQ